MNKLNGKNMETLLKKFLREYYNVNTLYALAWFSSKHGYKTKNSVTLTYTLFVYSREYNILKLGPRVQIASELFIG